MPACSILWGYILNMRGCPQERLAEQRAQAAADPDYDASFKGPRSKAEKKEKRKAILSAIGAASSRICCAAAPCASRRTLASGAVFLT
jgi:hypothetical protein